VVSAYANKRNAKGQGYVRHHAASFRFESIADEWFLIVDPTFYFTKGFFNGTNSPRLARLQSQALLFLIGWDRSGRWLRHGLRFRRGYRAPKLWPRAVTSP
jgi:hypothetical protein